MSSRVTFRVGPKDAGLFAAWLGEGVGAQSLTKLPNHHAVTALSHRGVPLDPFVLRTEPPAVGASREMAERARNHSRRNWARPVDELDPDFFGRWVGVSGSIAERTTRPPLSPASRRTDPDGSATGSSFLDEWLDKRRATDAATTPDGTDDEATDAADQI